MSAVEAGSSKPSGFGFDNGLFLGAVALGFGVMFVLKRFDVTHLAVTAVVASIVIAYSVLVTKTPRLRLRLDQAGDNAYYLGLIFTLFSMSWALWEIGARPAEIGPSGRSIAEIVIGDFGLALGSTLAGIICRIVLHQMRVDPADVEMAARQELALAAKRMQAMIQELAGTFGEFYAGLRQRHEDYVREMHEGNARLLSAATAQMDAVSKTASDAMSGTASAVREAADALRTSTASCVDALSGATERLRQIEPPPLRLSRGFSTLSERTNEIAIGLASAATTLREVVEAMKASSQSASALSESAAKRIPEILSRFDASDRATTSAVSGVAGSIAELSGVLGELQNCLKAIQGDAALAGRGAQSTIAAAKETVDGLTRVAETVEHALSKSLRNE